MEYIDGCCDPLPDGRVFRLAKSGNFISSGTLYGSDPIKEHIRTHKSKLKGSFDKIWAKCIAISVKIGYAQIPIEFKTY